MENENCEVNSENCCETEENARVPEVRSPEDKKAMITRLNRIAGQAGGVKKMIEEDRCCEDILIQLSSIDHIAKVLINLVLDVHMRTRLKEEAENVQSGNLEVIDEFSELIKRYL